MACLRALLQIANSCTYVQQCQLCDLVFGGCAAGTLWLCLLVSVMLGRMPPIALHPVLDATPRVFLALERLAAAARLGMTAALIESIAQKRSYDAERT